MDDSDVCAHCGQPLPGRNVVTYGRKGPNRTGVIVTIALHLLLVGIWLVQPKAEKHAPPKAGEAVVWLPPQPQQDFEIRPGHGQVVAIVEGGIFPGFGTFFVS